MISFPIIKYIRFQFTNFAAYLWSYKVSEQKRQ